MDEEEIDDLGAKRDRSPTVPYLGLTQSIDLAKKLYQVARSSEVRLAQVAPYWSTRATSGALARYAGALQGYGLIESVGSRENRKIHVTDDGRRILEDTRPGVAEGLKSKAALKPKMFELLFGIWGRNRPADDIAISALQFDHNFTPVAAKRFLTVFDEAVSYVSGDAGEGPKMAAEEPSQVVVSAPGLQVPESYLPPSSRSADGPSVGQLRRDVFDLDEGEATLTVPKSLSRASYEDFSAWLDLVKRKIERSVDQ